MAGSESFLHTKQFAEHLPNQLAVPYTTSMETPTLAKGSDTSFRKEWERPDSPFSRPIASATAMRPGVMTGSYIDSDALMHPRGLTGDIHPTTF